MLKATFSEDLSGLTYANLSYWFYTDGEMAEVAGLSNLPEVREMRYAFSNCDGLTELDLSGFPTEGAHGPVLLLLGLLEPGDNLGGCGLVAARGVRGVRHVLRLRGAGGRRGDDVRQRGPGRGLLPDRRPAGGSGISDGEGLGLGVQCLPDPLIELFSAEAPGLVYGPEGLSYLIGARIVLCVFEVPAHVFGKVCR